MREWVWTNACLSDELALYAAAHPELAPQVMSSAWRLTADFLVTGMSESVAQYARLQRAEASGDVAQALGELCANSQPIAAERALYLKCEGPATLMVEGDRVKVCRIAQNLLLNALQYTQQGGIKITWERADSSPERWMLCVQDSGPGLGTQATAPISVALDAATRDMQQIEKSATSVGAGGDDPDRAATLASRSSPRVDQPREGIGLAIVKRLCELLDASLELQTEPGKGSTFRVTFPTGYPKG